MKKYFVVVITPGPGRLYEDYYMAWGAKIANDSFAENGKEDALYFHGFDDDGYAFILVKSTSDKPDLNVFDENVFLPEESDINIRETTYENIKKYVESDKKHYRFFSIWAAERLLDDKINPDEVYSNYDIDMEDEIEMNQED